MFTYPHEFVSELTAAWKKYGTAPGERIPRLPAKKIVKHLLEVAYHASFMTEEMRRVVYHIIYCPRNAVQEPVPGGAERYGKTFSVVFDRSRPFNESELLRLAPATDPTKVLIGVEPADGTENEEPLQIWGLIDAGSSWWDFIHGESRAGNRPPDYLTISTAEPGNIVISRKGNIILKLQRGEIVRPTSGMLKRGPVADFFDDAVDRIYREACVSIKCAKYDYRGSDSYPQRLYLQYFERIIFHIRRKMHGGTLIVIPDNTDLQCAELQSRLMVKYPCSDERAWRLLVESLVLQHEYTQIHDRLLRRKCDICPAEYREAINKFDEIEEINDALSDSVKFIAALSGVDGAVLITDKLRLLGFGTEVVVSLPELSHVRVSQDVYGSTGKSIPIESFGTRHRAAFRFCSTCENSLALVISQDGGVKAVKKKGDDIILWSDINLGLFGI